MDGRAAYKIDCFQGEGFYADEEDDTYYVFGSDSGFAYSSWSDMESAERAAAKQNAECERHKQERKGTAKPPQTIKYKGAEYVLAKPYDPPTSAANEWFAGASRMMDYVERMAQEALQTARGDRAKAEDSLAAALQRTLEGALIDSSKDTSDLERSLWGHIKSLIDYNELAETWLARAE